MPLAWDAEGGQLCWLGADGAVKEELANYQREPDSLILGSAPTPSDGIQAPLVDVDGIDLEGADLSGRIAFTTKIASHIKRDAAGAGAAGIVSCHHPAPEQDPDSLFWNNTWSDRPGGWWMTDSDSRLFGFSVSPNQGTRLKAALSSGEEVRVRARVNTRLHEGELPFISGRIEGTDCADEELLVLSHIHEHGAHDNASGASTNLEIARSIAKGIRDGDLPRPHRSLRFLFVAECYGVLAYASLKRERIKHTVACINLDGCGPVWPMKVHREMDCARSGLAPLMVEVPRQVFRDNPAAEVIEASPEMGDTLLADPVLGVPTIWPHRESRTPTWHTSLDTMERLDVPAMKEMALAVGALLLKIGEFRFGRDCRTEAQPERSGREGCSRG